MSTPDSAASSWIACEGWWDEFSYGRQPMLQLKLRVAGGRITGSGIDIVGPFTFTGTISARGAVAMIKQYLGQHQVEYVGAYDGEGTMFGQWRLGPFKDQWAITFKRTVRGIESASEDVETLE